MDSKITYQRAGVIKSATIVSRFIPNEVAVKFVVIEQEIGADGAIPPLDDHVFLDELLARLGITIIDVSPTATSVAPQPYARRSWSK